MVEVTGVALLMAKMCLSGVVSARADSGFCKLYNQIVKNFADNPENNQNITVALALRNASLKATLEACKVIERRKIAQGRSLEAEAVNRVSDYLKHHLKNTHKKAYEKEGTELSEHPGFLLQPTNATITDRMLVVVKNHKQDYINELQKHPKLVLHISIEEAIKTGWVDGNKEIDWFNRVMELFAAEVQANTPLLQAIQNKTIFDVSKTLEELGVSSATIISNLAALTKTTEVILYDVKDIKEILSENLENEHKNRSKIDKIYEYIILNERKLLDKNSTSLQLDYVAKISEGKEQLDILHNDRERIVENEGGAYSLFRNVEQYVTTSSRKITSLQVLISEASQLDFQMNFEGVNVFVCCTTQAITTSFINQTKERVSSAKIVFIISSQVLNKGVLVAMQDDEHVKLFDEASFMTYVYNLDSFFESFQASYLQKDASKEYVHLNCIQPIYNDVGQHLENSYVESVHQFIERWLQKTTKNHLTILGDFGVGKTWLCHHITSKYLKKYYDLDRATRMPILISLKHYAQCMPWEEIVIKFSQMYNLYLTPEAFMMLNREGKLLIILDGFDELAFQYGYESNKENFNMLIPLVTHQGKVMMTSRKIFFENELDSADDALQRKDFEKIDLRYHERFGTIHLKDFNSKQIQQLLHAKLSKNKGDVYWAEIKKNHHLLELARRPVLLDIVIESLPKLIGKEKISMVELYAIYFDTWVNNVSATRSGLQPADRKILVSELAWKIYTDGVLELHDRDIESIIETKEIYGLLSRDQFNAELKNQSFLIKNENGFYYFAHKSFLEFLVAKHLQNDIALNNNEPFRYKQIAPEIQYFLCQLEVETTTLASWVSVARKKIAYIHLLGNVFSILHKLKYDFQKFDFSKLNIYKANFSGANLAGANFFGATLESVNFKDTNLSNTNFTDASITDLILGVRSPAKSVEASDIQNIIVSCNGENELVIINGDTFKKETLLPGHSDSITSVYFNDSANFMASCSFDKTAIVWDMRSDLPQIYKKIDVGDTTLYDVCITPDNNFVITADNLSRIKIWDLETAKEITSLETHDSTVYNIDIHPENTYIASASFDETAMLWKVDFSKKKVVDTPKVLKGHDGLLNGICFSPCGTYLATSSNDKKIIIWDVASAKELYRLEGHESIVWSVCFHPNGKYLASGSSDRKVIVWDLNTKKPLRILHDHEKAVWNVSFFKKGAYLVSGGFDNTVRVWDWATQENAVKIDLLEDTNQKINCTNMLLKNVEGLSPLQLEFLISKGAILT